MKKTIGLLLLVWLCLSCNNLNKDIIAYRITEKDLIPEGITYSPTTNSFYISSIYKTKIVQIDAETGEFSNFIPSDLLDLRFLGMVTDETRNHLWACANMTIENIHYSSVVKFDLKTGVLIKSYLHADTIARLYNDLTLDLDGNIYFTNSNKQTIYQINHKSDSVSLFFEGEEIKNPNGITISPDNKYLYITSAKNGIRVLDINKRKIIGEVDGTINSSGIDGLKYYNNSLIGIHNDVKVKSDTKIAQYFLDESGTLITGIKIIDQNNPHFDIPTTFVIVSDHLYCLANSQLGNMDFSNYTIRNFDALDDILILKYKLK